MPMHSSKNMLFDYFNVIKKGHPDSGSRNYLFLFSCKREPLRRHSLATARHKTRVSVMHSKIALKYMKLTPDVSFSDHKFASPATEQSLIRRHCLPLPDLPGAVSDIIAIQFQGNPISNEICFRDKSYQLLQPARHKHRVWQPL